MTTLDRYLENAFGDPPSHSGDLADEAHLAWWRALAASAPRGERMLEALGNALPQLRLAVQPCASQHPAYGALVRQARAFEEVLADSAIDVPLGGPFSKPESIELAIAEHPAGAMPVLSIGERSDFVRIHRALGARGEPIDVPPGVHALYVAGLPNPGRLREIRSEWLARGGDAADWPTEMARLAAEDRTHFHDRVILVSPGGYGDATDGWRRHALDEADWIATSGAIRLEHELAHHATHRLLGSYRLHLHDELVADFMGFTAALGTFDAALFLECLGVPQAMNEPSPQHARFRHYLGDLDERGLPALRALVANAAANLERFAGLVPKGTPRLAMLFAIARDGIATIAGVGWPDRVLASIKGSGAAR